LEEGDLILTGTPAGVGPGEYLINKIKINLVYCFDREVSHLQNCSRDQNCLRDPRGLGYVRGKVRQG